MLEDNHSLLRIKDHEHNVGKCQRCGTTIEPLLSEQWFVKMEPLAKEAIAAVKDGRIKFIPERWEKNYLGWMENIRDWCISRQIWWGHQIPAYYHKVTGEMVVAKENPILQTMFKKLIVLIPGFHLVYGHSLQWDFLIQKQMISKILSNHNSSNRI